LGCDGPCAGSRELARRGDEISETLTTLFARWSMLQFGEPDGLTAAAVVRSALIDSELSDVLQTLCGARERRHVGELTAHRVGMGFQRHRRRNVGGQMLVDVGRDRQNRRLWTVRAA